MTLPIVTNYFPLKVYFDEACTQPVDGPSIWHELHEGNKNVQTVYARNESRYDVLDISVSSDNPAIIVKLLYPTRLAPDQVTKAVVELTEEIHLGMDFSRINGKMLWKCLVQPRIIPNIPDRKVLRVPHEIEEEDWKGP